ncbi:MAG: RNA 2',3'-cyclic phosphodiesterase [Nanoarchaeota archaeon]
MTRTFISIDLPENVKKEVQKIQNQLPEFFGKKIELGNLHLTLKFLGEIDEEKIKLVKEKLKIINTSSFDLELDEIGVFSPHHIRIVWLHIKGADELQKVVDSVLGEIFKPEERFMGHLTIARVKNIKSKKEFLESLRKIEIPRIKFKAHCFRLMKSELRPDGPIYSVLEEYKLK